MAVINDMVTTMSTGELSLGLAGHRADHVQALQPGPLRDNQADTTGGSMQQDAVTGLEVIDAPHQVRRGKPAHGHGRRGLEGDVFRQFDQRRSRDQALSAVGAKCVNKAGIGDPIPDHHIAHALANR
ncbi:hypothetical protein D9M71_565860 [compost metagenome]